MRGNTYRGRKKRLWPRIFLCLLLAAAVTFGALEAVVLGGGQTHIDGQPPVMVIFGCQVKPWGPSILLQDRLDAALDYLRQHPDTTVVVTGGKGDDEHQSEAECMYDYLVSKGLEPERILQEDRSRNTWQNIGFTLQLLAEQGYGVPSEVLLVSNDFHLTRISMLWARATGGVSRVSTLAAPVSHAPSRIHMFFREPLALVKSFFFDR